MTTFFVFFFRDSLNKPPWSNSALTAWNVISRPFFVFAMLLALAPTFEGKLPWLQAFMAAPLFQVLGKLTFGAYLLHSAVIEAYFASFQQST